MKTLATTLPGLLSDMPRDRSAPVESLQAPTGTPVTTQHDELSEYELEPNDLERFELEDELLAFGLGFEELAESNNGPLEDEGFWTGEGFRTEEGLLARVSTRTKLMGSEMGMATAEYAIATLAAVGLAGLLVVILRSEEVRGFLLNLIRTALSLP